MEETRPSILALWGNDGRISHEDSMSYIRLMGQEVLPALREIGKELGLDSPFDLNTPVSRAYAERQTGDPGPGSALGFIKSNSPCAAPAGRRAGLTIWVRFGVGIPPNVAIAAFSPSNGRTHTFAENRFRREARPTRSFCQSAHEPPDA